MKHLDQFYTKESIARQCVLDLQRELGPCGDWDNVVEPSAGSGNFLRRLPPHAIGLDLHPTAPGIQQVDYLTWEPPEDLGRCLVIGNPPFGKNSKTAVNFFNRSARFADTIAFVLPRTFRKPSVIDRLDRNFHLVYGRVLPLASFHTPEGKDCSVPTCFQIWKRRDCHRPPRPRGPTTHPDWEWLPPGAGARASHAVRRVGAAAGKLVPSDHASPASHFFIRSNIDGLDVRWKSVWESCWREEIELNTKWDVAGNPSLTKEEIVKAYTQVNGIADGKKKEMLGGKDD